MGREKGGFQKGGFGGYSPVPKTGRRIHSDGALYHKPEQGYVQMVPCTTNRNEGTFLTLKLCRGSGRIFWADFTVNFVSESACLVPVERPEQARAMAQTNCNA